MTASRTGGALYATTESGGAFGHGSVISLTPPQSGGSWLVSNLYSFTGQSDGLDPNAGLVLARDGSLYGTTESTAFHLIPPVAAGGTWTQEIILSFNESNIATGNLVMDPAGNLYGTVESNPQGSNPLAIFRLTPPTQTGDVWTGNRVYNYSSSNEVQGGLAVTSKGVVISTLLNEVIALQVSADGQLATATTLYNFSSAGLFSGAPPLLTPSGVILLPVSGGSTYGQLATLTPPTAAGGSWTETPIFTFDDIDGSDPSGSLALGSNGRIYGTTYTGGSNLHGAVFQLTPPSTQGGSWTEQVLHDFVGDEAGQEPISGAIVSGSAIFGLAGVSGDNLDDLAFEITTGQ